MKILILVLLITFGSNCAFSQGVSIDKSSRVAKVVDLVSLLSKMASKATDDESNLNPQTGRELDKYLDNLQQQVETEVKKITEPQEIVMLGLFCRSILGSENAEDVSYDRVFNFAYWYCVELLAQNHSPASVSSLSLLEKKSNLIGGELSLFREIKNAGLRKNHRMK